MNARFVTCQNTSRPDVQTISIAQMTSMGRKGDYRVEVEDNDLSPIGSLVVNGDAESFAVQSPIFWVS